MLPLRRDRASSHRRSGLGQTHTKWYRVSCRLQDSNNRVEFIRRSYSNPVRKASPPCRLWITELLSWEYERNVGP